MNLRKLIGAGDRIMLLTLPVLAVGVVFNIMFPDVFRVGGPPTWLAVLSAVLLAIGVVGWAWSVYLILRHVPRDQLITGGPFKVVRHPLYVAVGLLVLPFLGLLLDTWLGVVVGLTLYVATRIFAPREEADLAAAFGPEWDRYRDSVLLPWL
jgi:protein-S-isoprenylcysteine O-methyltransferase Ste14